MTTDLESDPGPRRGGAWAGRVIESMRVYSFRWLVATSYVVYTVANFVHTAIESEGGGLIATSDLFYYQKLTKVPLWSLDYWAGTAPPIFPLFMRLFGYGAGLHAAHTVVFAACFGWAAVEAARAARHQVVGDGVFAVVLALSLAFEMSIWQTVVQTESLSNSMNVAMVAAGLRYFRRRDNPALALGLLVAVPAILVREGNTFAMLIVGLIAAIAWLRNRADRRLPLVAAYCLLLVVFTVTATNRLGRNAGTMYSFVSYRVLTEPPTLAWFESNGMPNPPILATQVEQVGWKKNVVMAYHPDLAEFRHWAATKANTTYTRYRLTHLGETLSEFGDHLSELFRLNIADRRHQLGLALGVDQAKVDRHLPWGDTIGGFVWGRSLTWTVVWTLLVAFGVLEATRRNLIRLADNPLLIVGGFWVLLSAPYALLSWASDIFDISRHGLAASLPLRLGLWCCVAALADIAISAVQERRTRPGTVTGLTD